MSPANCSEERQHKALRTGAPHTINSGTFEKPRRGTVVVSAIIRIRSSLGTIEPYLLNRHNTVLLQVHNIQWFVQDLYRGKYSSRLHRMKIRAVVLHVDWGSEHVLCRAFGGIFLANATFWIAVFEGTMLLFFLYCSGASPGFASPRQLHDGPPPIPDHTE